MIEIPLPSGVFARIRPLTFLDRLRVHLAVADGVPPMIAETVDSEKDARAVYVLAMLTSFAVTFDGERKSWDWVLGIDGRDAEALWAKLGPMLNGPVT